MTLSSIIQIVQSKKTIFDIKSAKIHTQPIKTPVQTSISLKTTVFLTVVTWAFLRFVVPLEYLR